LTTSVSATGDVLLAGKTSLSEDVLLAGNTSSSEDDVKVIDIVSWETEENIVTVAVSRLLVLKAVLALESKNDIVWPWVGSVLSESSGSLGVDCASKVTLTGSEIALDAEIACSVVEASLTSLTEATVLGTSAPDIDVGDGLLSSTSVWLEELVGPVGNVDSCTVLLLIMVVGSVLTAPLVASAFCELESMLGSWTGASLGWTSLGTVPLDWVLLLGNDGLENWAMLLVFVATGDAGLTLRDKVLVSSGRADVGSPWERETLVTCTVEESRPMIGRSDELEILSLNRGIFELEVAPDVSELATGSNWVVRVSADSTSVDDSRELTCDVPVGNGTVVSIVAIGLSTDKISCADPVAIKLDASAICDPGTETALELDERLAIVFDWGLEDACTVWTIDTKVSAIVLAAVRSLPPEVEPVEMVELCASTIVDDDLRLVMISLELISLDEGSADTRDVRGVLAAVLGSETRVVDDAELVIEIELPPEIGVCARELDNERSVDCDDTPSVGTSCEGFTATTDSVAELTACDVPNVTGKSEVEFSGCEGSEDSGVVLVEELGGPDDSNDNNVLAVKLVGCDETNVPEPSTVKVSCGIGPRVVTGLELDTVSLLETTKLGDCTPVTPAPITRVGDTWIAFSDWGVDEVRVVVGDLFDKLRETGSWPRIAEVSMVDEKPSGGEVAAWDVVSA
jgi:hypothetical protein